MNIKITDQWLREYLETDANPYEIQDYLSLCGPSIESVNKVDNDYVYDIEVISNRIDYASVIGIAREAAAILPQFKKTTKLIKNYLTKLPNNLTHSKAKLEIIDSDNLCPRKLAVVMEVEVQPSPEYITKRLEACGIRSLNNIIDITNYVMLETGHPAHVFDYDRVKTGVIKVRYAKDNEQITTLDKKTYQLRSTDIIFEDGTSRIIDLPGIMGLDNSVVTDKTKRIILWIETNDPKVIRQTSMRLGIRTVAASINEKNPDSQAALFAFIKGIEMYQQIAKGKIISPVYDINSKPKQIKSISLDYQIFEKIIGIKIDKKIIDKILISLGFEIKDDQVIVPSHRIHDISIAEDLVEEVARIYGYHNIPSNIQPPVYVNQPKDMEDLFVYQNKIKLLLKHLGLNEVINYSMVSKKLLDEFNFDIDSHLRLSNSISEDIEYLKTTLTPSLWKNIKDNVGKKDILKFFEIAKVYIKGEYLNQNKPYLNSPCHEVYKLGIATNTDYYDIKGIVESVFKELNIDQSIKYQITEKDNIMMTELDLNELITNSKTFNTYQPINPYAVIKLDKTFEISHQSTYEVVSGKAKKSKLLKRIEVVGIYKNRLTLRFYYSSLDRNITEEEAKTELSKV